jgi:predicted outer membrane repeat protein
LTIAASTISNNLASDRGGAIVARRGNLLITDSTINNNRIGGGIVKADSPDSATIINCTISGNSCGFPYFGGGGILQCDGTVTVIGSTIDNNSAFRGGGIYSTHGSVIVTSSTISSNSGGGIYFEGGGPFQPLTITHSTIYINSITTATSAFISHSVVLATIQGSASLFFSLVGGDPLLGPLADNGPLTLSARTSRPILPP